MRSPERSLSAQEFEGDDYPLDGIMPDDLPVRDIRGDEDDWHLPDEAGAEAQSEASQAPADARAVAADSFESVGIASEIAPSPPAPGHHVPAYEAHVPAQQVETESAGLSAQYLLPGLEPDALSGEHEAPKRLTRSRRPRASSDKRALRTAQIELWPQTESPTPER